jgi:hypothetical protein
MHGVRRQNMTGLTAGLMVAALTTVLPCIAAAPAPPITRAAVAPFRLATFSADITIPVGHACMGGGISPAKEIVDPLMARGVVLLGPDQPIVILAVDFCELRNDAYERWRKVLAQVAGTVPERVMLASVHQHDAPVCDLTAQKLLDEHGLKDSLCDPEFHERAVQRVAEALRESLASARPITHIGAGQAKVEGVASNRRVVGPDGKVAYPRNSATRDPIIRGAPEGEFDPFLKTISFWNHDVPVAAIHCYATHPMSYYGQGGVSADFVGMARARRQEDDPSVFQIYFSGCSGDITAGKFNDGAPENRPVLAERIYRGMIQAWEATRRQPLKRVGFRVVPLRLEPRNTGAFTVESMEQRLADTTARTFHRNLAAMGLSWHRRVTAGQAIDLPAVDFGPAVLLVLPAESFVAYQLMAQRLRPDILVMTAGYGECAPGYIPTERAFNEGFADHEVWCWVAPGAERVMQSALVQALAPTVTQPADNPSMRRER